MEDLDLDLEEFIKKPNLESELAFIWYNSKY